MPEVLTQSQIDKLLNELAGESTDEVSLHLDEKKVRPYNFRNPKKLTRDQQKVFRNIGEVFARHLASYLAGLTRTYCEVSVASLEEYPYKEYNNALPDMQVTGVLDVNLTKGAMLMDLSNSITFALIGRMFGGPVTEQEPPAREFTDIEVALMERIIRRITLLFQETWTFFPDMSMNLRQIETNTRFIKAIGMDDMVTSLVLAITLNQVKGTLTCCVPCVGILPVLDEIVSEQGGGAASADTDERLAEEHIGGLELPTLLVAILLVRKQRTGHAARGAGLVHDDGYLTGAAELVDATQEAGSKALEAAVKRHGIE
jgi:flagellar motor switch protein FliM